MTNPTPSAQVIAQASTEPLRHPEPDCRCPQCTPDSISSGSHAARLRAFMETQKRERA